MNDQNQNNAQNNGNYDFIMNQHVPELDSPKRSKKPLIIIGFIIAAFLALILVAVFALKIMGGTKQVVQTSDGKAESAKFLQLVANGQNDEAYNMYYSTYRPTKENFDKNAGAYNKIFDLNTCALQDQYTSVSDRGSKFIYRCAIRPQYKKKGSYIYLMFIYQTFDGVKQLRAIGFVRVE